MIDQDLIDTLLEAMANPAQREKWWRNYCNCINRSTEKEYTWRNAFYLSMVQVNNDFSTNQWLTFNQCKELWWKVISWAKSARIMFFTFTEKKWQENKADEDKESFPVVKYYRVFNLDQVTGVDPLWVPVNENKTYEDFITPIQKYVDSFDTLSMSYGPANYYSPPKDSIVVVDPKHRDDIDMYYGTMYHEAIHSSWHKDRLNRKEVTWAIKFWSHDYSVEELVAEFWSAMIASHLWAPINIVNSWAYLWSRAKKIKKENKEREVQRAIARAAKASEYVLSFSK